MVNIGDTGDLDKDKFPRAKLQYRNTPDRETKIFPAMYGIFGRSRSRMESTNPVKFGALQKWQGNRHFKTDTCYAQRIRQSIPNVYRH